MVPSQQDRRPRRVRPRVKPVPWVVSIRADRSLGGGRMSRQHQAGRREDSAPGPERPRWLFLVTGGLVYAGALLGMWIVLAGQPDTQDLAAGSVAAVLAVSVGYLLSQRGKMVPSVRAADLRTLAAVPWQVVVETGQVFALAARKASGRPAAPGALHTVPLDAGPDVRGTEHGRGGYRHGSRHGAGTPAGRCPAVRCTPGSARMSWFLAAALVLQVALIPC